ncbi:DNA polymerase delta subunit 3-like [Elysia marginata]|uniref:DNA polymerase delta subunit 3 n=1 Tax=Elysia marginata TaxID=1093978 RepID=A0AAV4JCF4_9GAST|nr:DNA polymerase delta subunit 3-like [Elysia marginata]
MASETDLLNENIGEYVNDDYKIVTCKWLSLTHSININEAKRALYAFVKHQRKMGGNDDINVTYFVAGLGRSKDGDLMHKCAVVPESELDVVKKSLSTLTSCHIFSVQKAKLKDYTPLYMTDYEITKNNLEKCNSFSSIKCPWVSLKSANPPSRTSQQNVVKPENKENAPSKKTESSNELVGSGAKVSGKKAEPKGSIASMFASASKKDDGGNKAAKPTQKTEAAPKDKVPEKKGGVMAFFEKKKDSPSNKKDTDVKKTDATTKKPESKTVQEKKQEPKRKKKQTVDSDDEAPDKKRRKRIRTDLFDSSDGEDAEASGNEDQDEDLINWQPVVYDCLLTTTTWLYPHIASAAKQAKPSCRDGPQVNNKARGRRGTLLLRLVSTCTRIDFTVTVVGHLVTAGHLIYVEEAEDNPAAPSKEEEERDEIKADNEEKEKEKEVSIASSNNSASSGKKRKRTKKVVTKHYQDEEGFMVTKKETVWESETDDEGEATTSKQEPAKTRGTKEAVGKASTKNTATKAEPKGKAAPKKNSSPQKSKQTSLMSFFKKK